MNVELRGRELLAHVSEWLARTPKVLEALVAGQSREALDRKPNDKAWSQSEILAHLADIEVISFRARVELILRGEPMPGIDPERREVEAGYATADPFASLATFQRLRAANLERVRSLSPADLEKRSVHSDLGEVTLGHFLAEMVIHDLSHVRQLAITAGQSFLPALGPWRPGYGHMEIRPKG